MEGYRYCPPEEWEGGMHLSAASELNYFELLMYTNGTIHIAYSVPLQKIYLGMHLTQNSSYSPEAMTFNVTYLYDFEKVSHSFCLLFSSPEPKAHKVSL